MAKKRFVLLFDLHGVIAISSRIAESYKKNHVDYLEKLGFSREDCEYRYDNALKKFNKDYYDNVYSTPIDEPFMIIIKNLFYQYKYDLLQDHNLVSEKGENVSFFHKKAIIAGCKNKEENYYLYPEVANAIIELSDKGFAIALATSAHSKHAKAVISCTSIKNYFDEILGFDIIKAHKSAPEFYLRCCKKLHFKKENCIVIGNSKDEIIVPKRLGMGTFFIDRERFVTYNVQSIADGSFSNLKELKLRLLDLVK